VIVMVRPLRDAAIRVEASVDRSAGVAMLSDSFASARDEGFFGFGGRHNAIDQHGNLLSSFVEEENVNGKEAFGRGGNGRWMYPSGPSAAYYPQAEFFSSRGYGFLLNSPQLARFRMGSDRANTWNAEVSAPSLDYVVAPGAPATAIRNLTALSGRQPVPPALQGAADISRTRRPSVTGVLTSRPDRGMGAARGRRCPVGADGFMQDHGVCVPALPELRSPYCRTSFAVTPHRWASTRPAEQSRRRSLRGAYRGRGADRGAHGKVFTGANGRPREDASQDHPTEEPPGRRHRYAGRSNRHVTADHG
jgi:hypothetical protein